MGKKVLIIDDSEINREILKDILYDKYETCEAENVKEALQLIQKHVDSICASLLDLYMPEVDGIQVLDTMMDKGWIGKIPILVISSETSTEVEKKCFLRGISDFIHKPFDYDLIRRRLDNIVNLYELRNNLEEKVDMQTIAIKKQYKLLVYQAEKLKRTNDKIIEVLGSVVECRDYQDGTHVQHVKDITRILAKVLMEMYPEYGLTEELVERFAIASALHDIGKISIPDSILLKPAKLSDEEKELMKSHPLRGCEIVETFNGAMGKEMEKTLYDICRSHHERYDGRGYPDGLIGDEIPISAQIVSLADAYDELISERIYKNASSLEEAFNSIVTGECGIFSPKLIECFRVSRTEIEEKVL